MPLIGCLLVIFLGPTILYLLWQLLQSVFGLYWQATLYILLPLGGIYGVGVAIKNYFIAFRENIGYSSASPTSQPASRNYFFDKRAYKDLIEIIQESWESNFDKAKDCFAKSGERWYIIPLLWAAGLSICIFGTVVFLAFSAIHIVLMFVLVFMIFSLYSIIGMMDLIYRKCKGIFTVCPSCYTKGKLPVYHCPNCNAKHDKLYPGSYGIFMRKCDCGKKIPTMFFNGRSKLEASCANCGYSIKSKESRPISIPIVGAPYAGKTYFLFSMVWYIKEKFAPSKGLGFEFPDDKTNEMLYNSYIKDLNAGKSLPKTVENNPIALNFFLTKGGNRSLMYFYDSAGEAFASTQHLVQHKFYEYFNGLVFIIDPFSIPEIQSKYEAQMKTAGIKPSSAFIEDIYEALIINLEKNYKVKVTERVSRPTAIVFSKTGLLDLPMIFGSAYTRQDMNDKCRQFLKDNGEGALLKKIEYKFKNAQFFAIDSNGQNSTGINSVADWLLGEVREKRKFANIVSLFAAFISILSGLLAMAALVGAIWALSPYITKPVTQAVDKAVTQATQAPPDLQWYVDNPNALNFTISTPEELEKLSQIVNGTWKKMSKKNSFAGRTITLAKNISLAQINNWVPIGDSASPFSGTFNGGGHVISNLTISRPGADYQGLFGFIDGGKVQNLGIDKASILGRNVVGGVAGRVGNNSKITSSYFSGKVTGNDDVGGVAAKVLAGSTVLNSYSDGAVSGINRIGGVAGSIAANSYALNSYSASIVNGTSWIGGVAGQMVGKTSSLSSCAALNPEVKGVANTGRVVGASEGKLSNNVALAEMKNRAGKATWNNKSANAVGGLNIANTAVKRDGTVGGRFTAANGWKVQNGSLPKL